MTIRGYAPESTSIDNAKNIIACQTTGDLHSIVPDEYDYTDARCVKEGVTLPSPTRPGYNLHMHKHPAQALLEWYSMNARDLPWRRTKDPYAVWVSEVMLQQTRVDTVIPYYMQWMERFPNLEKLVEAEIDDVLQLWEGLGYYRRAHNLYQAAKWIINNCNGIFPNALKDIESLPGVGSYTAAAIAAFAYDADVIAYDGNLRRVLSRLFDYSEDPRSPKGEGILVSKALEWMPCGVSSKFNQALMDLGALICHPRTPQCSSCPLKSHCQAFAAGVQEERPIRKKRDPIPHFVVTAGVLERNGKVLIARRPEGELLGGLWEFPGGKCKEGETLEDCLLREWLEEIGLEISMGESLGEFSHAYTHFRVTVHAFKCKAFGGEPEALEHSELCWVNQDELKNYPMGKVDREISRIVAGKT
jgi:A/G-specific adenine glycosylase